MLKQYNQLLNLRKPFLGVDVGGGVSLPVDTATADQCF